MSTKNVHVQLAAPHHDLFRGANVVLTTMGHSPGEHVALVRFSDGAERPGALMFGDDGEVTWVAVHMRTTPGRREASRAVWEVARQTPGRGMIFLTLGPRRSLEPIDAST